VVDDPHMQRAIALAHRHPHTHPNPRVGAVVVDRGGEVLGEGFHRGPGTPHAEIAALEQAGEKARGAIIYVTLEPCAHHHRTPPCADALIEAGIARVVVGAIDPDSRVSGAGIDRLRNAGVDVTVEEDQGPARAVDPAYFRHRKTGLPLVTLKWAMTLDGSVAAQDGSSRWITSEEARAHAHRLRSTVDAVVVGAGTLRRDDPSLDVRIDGYDGHQPRPVVIAGRSPLPTERRIWSRDPVVVSSSEPDIPSGELLTVPGQEFPDPVETARALADLGYLHLLLEGGPTLAGAWWRAGLADRGVVYVGARMGGGNGRAPLDGFFASIDDAVELEFVHLESVGRDVVIEFEKKP
jgi:diaminohydroxyphosphoribosylaminopyrimidine deaminase/5-amino-6-(5-phosphoribosylamino)uracil reductase